MNYKISGSEKELFNNNTFYCIGTGRMGLALQKAYYEQLKLVQDKIGFEHIRGHGLFCKDMAIYHVYDPENKGKPWEIDLDSPTLKVEYNWTYLDMVMDSYKELHIKPFIELGFMPEDLASDQQTIFYWKGNVTPPRNYKFWAELVKATLNHLISRYGRDEVVTWPVEVWNEPNMPGFWKNADMSEYFKLYDVTSRAVKEVDSKFRVGGPAICGVEDIKWITEFLKFVEKSKCPMDFVTRHHYTTENPTPDGHYGYPKLNSRETCFDQLKPTRGIVDSFPAFKDMEIHVTEYNTSYIPNAPVHDMNLNAAYIANMLSTFGDAHASYSYWTFGDIFEEWGVPFTPFHGGFGLVADGLIPKPTFWTFAFYKKLTKQFEKCVLKTPECVVVQCKADKDSLRDGEEAVYYKGVCWNLDTEMTGNPLELEIELPLASGADSNSLLVETVDEEVCNPLKVWHDLGEHANPSSEEIEILREAAQPQVKTARCGNKVKLTLSENAVCYFEIKTAAVSSDRGYKFGRLY